MTLGGYALYLTTILIWGSTWLAIKFQLGDVDPLASVIYRFGLASLLLFGWCLIARVRLRLSRREHAFILLQGVCLFGLNYWLIYWSEVYLTSGIVAVIFASLVFLNIFNARLFLKRPLSMAVILGALVGMCGISLLFWPEFHKANFSGNALLGLAFGLASTGIASIGNILATRNGVFGLSVISVNAWGMLYGTLTLLLIALIRGVEFRYAPGVAYTLSLLYLSVFGSILAFGAYLKLLASIGPDRAGYTSMLIPVVALGLSTLYEGYVWTLTAVIGLVLILAGNVLVMRRKATLV